MEAVVHVAAEIIAAMEPRAGTNENIAAEPLGAIIAGRSAAIGSGIIIAIRTFRRDADSEADLGLCFGGHCCKTNRGNGRRRQKIELTHEFTFGLASRNLAQRLILHASLDACATARSVCQRTYRLAPMAVQSSAVLGFRESACRFARRDQSVFANPNGTAPFGALLGPAMILAIWTEPKNGGRQRDLFFVHAGPRDRRTEARTVMRFSHTQ